MKMLPSRLAAACGVAAAALALSASPSFADSLAVYNFNGYVTSDSGSSVSSTASGVSATNFVPNGGTVTPRDGFRGVAQINGGAGNYMFQTNGTGSNGTAPYTAFGIQSLYTAASNSAATAANAYYSFTLTPDAGSALSFGSGDALTFAQQTRINSGTASPYTAHFFLRASTDGGTTFMDVGQSADLTRTGVGSTGLVAGRSIDLSSIGALATGTSLTLRFYPVDNQQANSGSNNDDLKVDDVVLNGSVVTAVPSPAAFGGGLTLGAVTLLGWRRRSC